MLGDQVKRNGGCVQERGVVLVTGGAGFIGSHIVDELLALGHKVVALDDLSGGSEQNI